MAKANKPFDQEENANGEDVQTLMNTPTPGQYIGPDYVNGLYINGTGRQWDPRSMNAEEAALLISIYPPAQNWWTK